jgi:hypothetical protein
LIPNRLNAYALAATAAGVGLLPRVQPAETKLLYTPANKDLTKGSINLDLNHDGIVDFVIEDNFQVRTTVHISPRAQSRTGHAGSARAGSTRIVSLAEAFVTHGGVYETVFPATPCL